jgi:hypothetical protein
MLVDTTAAMQGVIDAKEKHYLDDAVYQQIITIMNRISKRGEYGRSVFDLNEFFKELALVDFGKESFVIGWLMESLGKSISSGLTVASPYQ